jgi:hypothetical protein
MRIKSISLGGPPGLSPDSPGLFHVPELPFIHTQAPTPPPRFWSWVCPCPCPVQQLGLLLKPPPNNSAITPYPRMKVGPGDHHHSPGDSLHPLQLPAPCSLTAASLFKHESGHIGPLLNWGSHTLKVKSLPTASPDPCCLLKLLLLGSTGV